MMLVLRGRGCPAAASPWVGGLSLRSSASPSYAAIRAAHGVAGVPTSVSASTIAVGDVVGEVVGAAAGTEGVDDRLLVGGEAVELEEVGVGAHGGVEADQPGDRCGARA